MNDLETVLDKLRLEFEYSKKWDDARKDDQESVFEFDKNKPVESWICWMEEYLRRAKHEATNGTDKTLALKNIKYVANLAINCLIYRGCPDR